MAWDLPITGQIVTAAMMNDAIRRNHEAICAEVAEWKSRKPCGCLFGDLCSDCVDLDSSSGLSQADIDHLVSRSAVEATQSEIARQMIARITAREEAAIMTGAPVLGASSKCATCGIYIGVNGGGQCGACHVVARENQKAMAKAQQNVRECQTCRAVFETTAQEVVERGGIVCAGCWEARRKPRPVQVREKIDRGARLIELED